MITIEMREHAIGMRLLVRPGLFVALLLTLLLLTSCADATTTVQATPTTAATGSTPTATTTAASEAVVKTAQATIDGNSVTILTDAKGMALYYYSQDTASTVACTGICAQIWPALQFSGSGEPQSSEQLPGQLKVSANANGNQVTYNGHPLYTYITDQTPGQVTGHGINNMSVATPDLAPI